MPLPLTVFLQSKYFWHSVQLFHQGNKAWKRISPYCASIKCRYSFKYVRKNGKKKGKIIIICTWLVSHGLIWISEEFKSCFSFYPSSFKILFPAKYCQIWKKAPVNPRPLAQLFTPLHCLLHYIFILTYIETQTKVNAICPFIWDFMTWQEICFLQVSCSIIAPVSRNEHVPNCWNRDEFSEMFSIQLLRE